MRRQRMLQHRAELTWKRGLSRCAVPSSTRSPRVRFTSSSCHSRNTHKKKSAIFFVDFCPVPVLHARAGGERASNRELGASLWSCLVLGDKADEGNGHRRRRRLGARRRLIAAHSSDAAFYSLQCTRNRSEKKSKRVDKLFGFGFT
jgi:hypothetical protein